MPIYEFRCTHCGKEIEVLQKISAPQPTDCPACGQTTLTKKLSAAGFQLKGSGWYATDFKSTSTPAPTESAPATPPPCAATGSCPACE